MRKMILAAMALVAATAVHARNEAVMLPLADVVKLGLEQGKLDGSVSFHLSGASTPAISEKLGDDVSNKKTNGVGKDDATACNWAALSALMAFEAKAKQRAATPWWTCTASTRSNPPGTRSISNAAQAM